MNQELETQTQSSEEHFIRDFLKLNNIKFQTEVVINELTGDVKKYRRADFYLPRLKVYVEYFGHYNASKEKRLEYDNKAKIYIRNGIPTVFIYPHELGFIEYAFHTKIVRLLKLKKFNLRRQLFRYRLNRYLDNIRYGSFKTLFISSLIFFVLTIFETGLSEDLEVLTLLVCLSFALFSTIEIFFQIRNYFFKDR